MEKKKYWAVMPKHKECFSLIYSQKDGLFAQAIFATKSAAIFYKENLNSKGVDKTELIVIPVTITP